MNKKFCECCGYFYSEIFPYKSLNVCKSCKELLKRDELIERLQKLYDDNSLSEKDEVTILDTIEFFGGEINCGTLCCSNFCKRYCF